MQMREVMTSKVVSLKRYNTQSRISPEILDIDLQTWHQKCTSQKKQNDAYYVVAMETLLAPVSFREKTNIPVSNLLNGDRGSSSEHT